MADYKLTNFNSVIRTADWATIPMDADNADYQKYLKWVEDGNTADPADAVDPWSTVRQLRDLLLQQCDWTQLADSPLDADTKTAWASYREALRNIPQNFATPDAVVWPTPPA